MHQLTRTCIHHCRGAESYLFPNCASPCLGFGRYRQAAVHAPRRGLREHTTANMNHAATLLTLKSAHSWSRSSQLPSPSLPAPPTFLDTVEASLLRCHVPPRLPGRLDPTCGRRAVPLDPWPPDVSFVVPPKRPVPVLLGPGLWTMLERPRDSIIGFKAAPWWKAPPAARDEAAIRALSRPPFFLEPMSKRRPCPQPHPLHKLASLDKSSQTVFFSYNPCQEPPATMFSFLVSDLLHAVTKRAQTGGDVLQNAAHMAPASGLRPAVGIRACFCAQRGFWWEVVVSAGWVSGPREKDNEMDPKRPLLHSVLDVLAPSTASDVESGS